MQHTRRQDQSVDAFSLPVSLLEQAKARASELSMTKSGFYRFCLAKMLGYSEEDARKLSEHRAVLNSVEKGLVMGEGGKAAPSTPAKPANYKNRVRRKSAPVNSAPPSDATTLVNAASPETHQSG